MPVRINSLEVENVKRVRAVRLLCDNQALTIIGGDNNAGKTSVLDAICFALGGAKFQPTNLRRDDAITDPYIKVQLSNGITVERKGKNASLKVTDPSNGKAGQSLLDAFVSELALDLRKFIQANDREKADTLLRIIGVGSKLAEIEAEEKRIYDERQVFGRIADQKVKFAEECRHYPDAPEVPISAAELIKSQQEILARNGENQRLRNMVAKLEQDCVRLDKSVADRQKRVEDTRRALQDAEEQLARAKQEQGKVASDLVTARKSAEQLKDESTLEIEHKLSEIDSINQKVQANLDKEKALEDAKEHQQQYSALTAQLEEARRAKAALLDGAHMPLDGLTVNAGVLQFHGQPWDGMSGSQQLRVATAIVRKLKPDCGFVLIDKLEQFDLATLHDFGAWLETEGLQVIATRVSRGDECSIVIEDGSAIMEPVEPEQLATADEF